MFVGRPRYIEGLELLLRAISLLPEEHKVQLDVIGISDEDYSNLGYSDLPVIAHGYLSKADAAQRAMFYGLLNPQNFGNTDRRLGANCTGKNFRVVRIVGPATDKQYLQYQLFQILPSRDYV